MLFPSCRPSGKGFRRGLERSPSPPSGGAPKARAERKPAPRTGATPSLLPIRLASPRGGCFRIESPLSSNRCAV